MDRAALDTERLRGTLAPRWAHVDVVDETASTNADLLARADLPDRSVLAAEHQTSGRGRFDRSWSSPPGAGLTFSVLLRPHVPLVHWGWLPLLAGVAVAEAVADVTGVEASLKWPNDVLAGGGKLAGILAQTADEAVVLGIGCNVSTTSAELPTDSATSLALCGVREVDRTALLAAMLTQLDARVAQWADCNGDAASCGLTATYRRLCDTIGASVRVTISDGNVVEGVAEDLDEIGRLVVRTPTGSQTIGAGDVEHVRPA